MEWPRKLQPRYCTDWVANNLKEAINFGLTEDDRRRFNLVPQPTE